MSRGTIGLIAVGAFLFVLQQSVFVSTEVFGVSPELLLLLAVCAGISGGADRGAIAGFVAGLANDVFLISPLGLCAFVFAAVGYLAGAISDDMTPLPGVTALIAAAATAIALLAILIVGRITGELGVTFGHGFAVVFVASLLNGVLAPLLCGVLRSFQRRDHQLSW